MRFQRFYWVVQLFWYVSLSRSGVFGDAGDARNYSLNTTLPHQPAGGTGAFDKLPCATSGMCSLGQVQPFTGDIWPSAALRSCLTARAFRRELIMLTESRLAPAYQTFANLLDMGYEHVVLLSLPGPCERSTSAWPRLSCVWSSQPITGNTKYLMDRVSLLTRAIRLGYNVLMLDSDVIFFNDVYSSLKQPPLSDANILAMRDGNGWLNCGVVYVQNARPDGATAYMLGEIVDRTERWAADPDFVKSRGYFHWCWDQAVYSDTLLSTIAGRPMAPLCWIKGHGEILRQWEIPHLQALGVKTPPNPNGYLMIESYMKAVNLTVPEVMVEASAEYTRSLPRSTLMAEMRVPNTQGTWPEGLGGPLYPPKRRDTAQVFIDRLKEDVLPMWPDPEDPTQEAVAAAAPRERFAFLPLWMAQSWNRGGHQGYWIPALMPRHPATGRPMHPQLVAHFVHVPGGASNKLTIKMAYGHWDWDVAHRAHPARGVFFASTRHVPLPDVLALAPEVEAREWASEREFDEAAMSLLRLAMEMGRAAALPAPRCSVPWLGGERNTQLPLVVPESTTIPYARPNEGFGGLRCLWGGYLQYGCQAVRWYYSGALLAPEYDHYLDLLRQETQGAAHGSSGTGTAGPSQDGVSSGGATADGVGTASGNGTSFMVMVPREVLEPPGGPNATWEVDTLAKKLMEQYGGPGSGLLQPRMRLKDPGAAQGENEAHGQGQGGKEACSGQGGRCISSGPRVLVLPEVPRLSGVVGQRHLEYRRHAHEDLNRLHCDWVESGRYTRRRRRVRRQ